MKYSSRNAGLVGGQCVFLSLSWIFVFARLYVRKRLVKKVDFDDYFLILTLALYTILAAFIITIASLRPFSYDLTLLQLGAARGAISKGLHLFFLCEVFYILTCASLRISVGLLLLRVASSPAQRRVIYLIMLLMICSSIAFLFVVIFQCNPISYFWNETPGAVGTCVKSSTVADTGYAHMAVAFISDWTLGLLPAWLLWNVQISRGRKIGISILLGFGLLCGVVAIVRTPIIKDAAATSDFERDWVPLALISIIEPGLGIIAASIATLRPLFSSQRLQTVSSLFSGGPGLWKGSKVGKKPNGSITALTSGSLEEGKAGIELTTTVETDSLRVSSGTHPFAPAAW